MFCINCGTRLPDIARFCPSCGTATALANATPSTAAAVPPSPPPAPEVEPIVDIAATVPAVADEAIEAPVEAAEAEIVPTPVVEPEIVATPVVEPSPWAQVPASFETDEDDATTAEPELVAPVGGGISAMSSNGGSDTVTAVVPPAPPPAPSTPSLPPAPAPPSAPPMPPVPLVPPPPPAPPIPEVVPEPPRPIDIVPPPPPPPAPPVPPAPPAPPAPPPAPPIPEIVPEAVTPPPPPPPAPEPPAPPQPPVAEPVRYQPFEQIPAPAELDAQPAMPSHPLPPIAEPAMTMAPPSPPMPPPSPIAAPPPAASPFDAGSVQLACPRCGAIVPEGRKFCTACGFSLTGEPETNPPPSQPLPRTQANTAATLRQTITNAPAAPGTLPLGLVPLELGILGGLVLAAISTFLDWASFNLGGFAGFDAPGLSVNGWRGDARFQLSDWLGMGFPLDALIVVLAAGLGAFAILGPRLQPNIKPIHFGSAIAGGVIAIVGVLNILFVSDLSLDVGLGLYLLTIGGGVAVVCTFVNEQRKL